MVDIVHTILIAIILNDNGQCKLGHMIALLICHMPQEVLFVFGNKDCLTMNYILK